MPHTNVITASLADDGRGSCCQSRARMSSVGLIIESVPLFSHYASIAMVVNILATLSMLVCGKICVGQHSLSAKFSRDICSRK